MLRSKTLSGRLWFGALTLAAATGVGLHAAPTALAATPDQVVVSANPADWTPWVSDGEVRAIVEIGSRVVVGGSFTQVQEPGGAAVSRNYLFAFDTATGRLDDRFVPALDGAVNALALAPDGDVLVGGAFGTVNGSVRKGVVELDLETGATVARFGARTNGAVLDLALHGNRLFLAGYFGTVNGVARTKAAAVDATTGVLDPGFDFAFSDPMSTQYVMGSLQVTDLAITSDGSRLVAIGNFTKVNGVARYQVAVFDLWTSPATLADWSTDRYQPTCPSRSTAFYVRDVAFDPSGTYFVIVSTGAWGRSATSLCDTATRWEIGASGSAIQPSWIAATGGDTLLAVAITGSAVYVGGHERWHNNPYAGDRAGPGAVAREGIAALDPKNGVPLAWNPGRERGDGVKALVPTATGLWIGSDTNTLGGEWHPKLGFFPTAGGASVREPTIASLPGALHKVGPGDVLTRQPFDGTAIGAAETVTGSVSWSQARGSFLVGGKLYTGWSDGKLYVRDYDGQTLGPATVVSVNGLQTLNFQVSSLTGAFVDPGTARLYYTQSGDANLYYRGFTLDSQIVGALRYTAPAGGINWSSVRGMTMAGGRIYYADSSGNLRRIAFENGAPSGTPILLSGPATGDGRTWNGNGLFLAPASATPPPPPPPAAEYEFTGNGSASFHSWQVHAFAVGTTPKQLRLRLDWDNAAADLNLFLKNPAGTTVAFANGTTNKPETLTHTATSPGTWTVAVSIKTGAATYQLLVNPPNTAPTAGFTFACTGLACEFDGTGSSDVDGTIAGYNWDFGDGMSGSGVNPEHSYATGGTYTVRLTVTDDRGATAATTHTITVTNAVPAASFTADCDELACSFDGSGSTDPDGSISGYSWDFGDGSTGTGAQPSHTYSTPGSYTVTLTVTDNQGGTGGSQQELTVVQNAPPTASFTFACTDLACSFDGSGSSDSDGTVASYSWDFGDLSPSGSGVSPSYTYAQAGTYTMTLTVTDDDGAGGTASQAITVTAPNGAPTASFTLACTDLACSFDGSGSSDSDGTVASYSWDFGDLSPSGSGVSPSYTYAQAGTYTVTLTVTDDDAASGSTQASVTVTDPPPANSGPTADAQVTCEGATCSFDGSGSTDSDGSIVAHEWDFGDGTSGAGATPTHVYSPGTYTASLTVTDDDGATAASGVTVTIPTAEFVFVGSGAPTPTAQSFKVHSFPVEAPKQLTIRLDWDNPGADLNVFLRNPAGTTVAFANGTTQKPETVTYTATTTGTWSVAVKIKNAPAAYELLINPY